MLSQEKELNNLVLHELLKHFKDRPEVQNIDVMNTAGFCRNCLAKWRHAAAKKLNIEGMTYEDSLEYVYGMSYDEYKKKYQKKATETQLELFNSNQQLHAAHQSFDPSPVIPHSSVCCDEDGKEVCQVPVEKTTKESNLNEKTGFIDKPVKIALLTLSDRAFHGIYKDQSGPSIENILSQESGFQFQISSREIIPDEFVKIAPKLIELSLLNDVILTTGGTGVSKRDVTPQATASILDRSLPGISEMLRRETAKMEPMAWLSRGEAGMREKCLIINFPGNPKAAEQYTRCVIPLIPRLVNLLRES